MKKLKIIHTVYGDASGGRWQAMLNTFDALESHGHEGVLVFGNENKKLKSENYPTFCLNSSGFYDPIAPNKDMSREPQTLIYNRALQDLADGKRVLHISYYDELKQNLDLYYDDSTHLSSLGQQVVTDAALDAIRKAQS